MNLGGIFKQFRAYFERKLKLKKAFLQPEENENKYWESCYYNVNIIIRVEILKLIYIFLLIYLSDL